MPVYQMPSSKPVEYFQHIEPTSFLNDLEHHLKGEKYDPDQSCWVAIEGLARLNERGVQRVMQIVRLALNKVVFLSNLHQRHVARICRNLHCALAEEFLYHWRDYGMEKGMRSATIDMIMTPIYAGIMHAENEGDRGLVRDTTSFNAGRDPQSQSRAPKMV